MNPARRSSVKCTYHPAYGSNFILILTTVLAWCACISAHFLTLHCVCFVQGHSRAGEVQDHYDGLLQRSHGECRTPAEQADWIIRLTSPPLCARSVPFTDSFNPLSLHLFVSLFALWQGIILVYDITDEKSFENIQNWMKSIKEVRLFPLSQGKDNQERRRNSA